MHADDLEIGFRLGDWVFEPRLARISGNGRSHALAFHHVRILQLLAERHGEVVERGLLRDRAWPGQHSTDDMLRAAIRELREILGDSSRDPSLHRQGVEAWLRADRPLRAAGSGPGHASALPAIDPFVRSCVEGPADRPSRRSSLSELRRRSVLQVARRLPARHVDHAAGGGGHLRAAAPARSGG